MATIADEIQKLLNSGFLDDFTEEVHYLHDPVFNRICEVLYDYWLVEKDESRVVVTLDFWKGDEHQAKQLTWVNPEKR